MSHGSRSSQSMCTPVAALAVGWLAFATSLSAAEPAAPINLLNTVTRTADGLLEYGSDQWGPEKTALIISMLDRRTHQPLAKLPGGSAGVRNSDRTTIHGSNVNMQQNLFRTFYLLSELTGNPRYAAAADAALIDFVRKTQSPVTGLLAWGEHLCWDLETDQVGTLDQKLIHEPKKPLVFWDYLYEHEPERMLTYATGIWEHQIADHKTGNFSRHASYDKHSPRTNYDFTKEAGHFIDIWSRAYEVSKDPVYATAIRTLVKRYQGKLNDQSLLDYDSARADYCNNGHNITLAAELHDSAARMLNFEQGKLSAEMQTLATAIDRGFLALSHRPDVADAGFIATSTTVDGQPRDRDGVGPGGYSVLWGMGYGRQTTSMVAQHCFRRALQLEGTESAEDYRQLAQSACSTYEDSGPCPADVDVWPVEYGTTILMHLSNYQSSGDKAQMQQARRRAEEAVRIFWDKSSPLPKCSSKRSHFENITGMETLVFALLAVHLTETQSEIAIPFSDIDR